MTEVKLPFDVGKIKWEMRVNEKGMFEVSSDVNSLDHKALLKWLSEYGSMPSNGYFYWVYQNGWQIGRKPAIQRARLRGR